MKPIGGFFELAIEDGEEYHRDALRLNLGRNALEYILKSRGYQKVWLPEYCCETLLQPIQRLGLSYAFYPIEEDFSPLVDEIDLRDDEALLVVNYFGLCRQIVQASAKRHKNLIVDNSQAFFERPLPDVDTFYSPRKFFGVPDGAYLYTSQRLDLELPRGTSWQHAGHLLKRVDQGPEAAYPDYQRHEALLGDSPLHAMSPLTERLLSSVDYARAARARAENYKELDKLLGGRNRLSLALEHDQVPMVYPFLSGRPDLRGRLIADKLFVAQYWAEALNWTKPGSVAYDYASRLIPLPIDQRYTVDDMKEVSRRVENNLAGA